MATGAISSPGLGSNLDVNGIVSKLMALEQQPLADLTAREGDLTAELSLIGQMKGAISNVQTAATSLATAASAAKFSATASDSTILSATASSSAGTASHSVTVTNIAQAQRIAAAGQASKTAQIGSGATTTLTISFGTIGGGVFDSNAGTYSGASFTANGSRAPVTVTIGSSNNTLEGIRDAINAQSGGVTASIVNDGSGSPFRLVLSAVDTGAANSVKVDVSGDAAIQGLLAYDPAGTQNLTQLQASQDAKLSVDGVSITSGSNAVSGAIDGVTLNLIASGTTKVTVARDITQIASTLSQLVKSYNDSNSAISTATAKGAALQGDYGTLSTLNRLRSEFGAIRPGFGDISSLSELGVSFARDGSLTFDSSKLQAALSSDFDNASGMIGAFAKALSATAKSLLGDNGSIQAKTDSINATIKSIDSRKDALNARLQRVQDAYLAQFTALDTLISNLKSTSTFLDQQLANLPSITGTNK